jgi:hypothetical protein
MKRVAFIIIILLLGILVFRGYANPYKLNLAYVNKTYSKDIHYSEELYKSFEKHYDGSSNYFICVPEQDFDLFYLRFQKLLSDKIIKKMPIIVKEESLLLDSELEDYNELSGHEQQQVIKMSFWRYNNIPNYVTFDSDITIIRAFDDSIFFDFSGKNPVLKTVMSDSKESAFSIKIDDVFLEYDAHKKTHDKYFVAGYGLWNSFVLQDLLEYIKKKDLENFAEIIKIAPVEMEWYGKFLYLVHYDTFYKQSPIVLGIQGFISQDDFSAHRSQQDMCGDYCGQIKKDPLGIYIHYHTLHRSGYTLNDFMKDCNCK